jgi:hypothetical protein
MLLLPRSTLDDTSVSYTCRPGSLLSSISCSWLTCTIHLTTLGCSYLRW